LSQRDLARLSGIPQPAIARIEQGRVTPRVDTLVRLLASCGRVLRTSPQLGHGVDRTLIRHLRQLTPRQRLDLAVNEAASLDRLMAVRR